MVCVLTFNFSVIIYITRKCLGKKKKVFMLNHALPEQSEKKKDILLV